MPVYEFSCQNCHKGYESLIMMRDYDPSGAYPDVKCPQCQSASKRKLISKPNFAFANPIGTDRWNSDSGGHEYRFKTNVPNVINQRAAAEAASHVGANPYNSIDDISSGSHFGEVV